MKFLLAPYLALGLVTAIVVRFGLSLAMGAAFGNAGGRALDVFFWGAQLAICTIALKRVRRCSTAMEGVAFFLGLLLSLAFLPSD